MLLVVYPGWLGAAGQRVAVNHFRLKARRIPAGQKAMWARRDKSVVPQGHLGKIPASHHEIGRA